MPRICSRVEMYSITHGDRFYCTSLLDHLPCVIFLRQLTTTMCTAVQSVTNHRLIRPSSNQTSTPELDDANSINENMHISVAKSLKFSSEKQLPMMCFLCPLGDSLDHHASDLTVCSSATSLTLCITDSTTHAHHR